MLKDITLGQYYPADSVVHKLDSRTKILITLLYMVMIFVVDGFIGFGVLLLFNIFSNIVLHTARNFAVFLAEILYRAAASEFLQQAPAQMHMEFTGTISFGFTVDRTVYRDRVSWVLSWQ